MMSSQYKNIPKINVAALTAMLAAAYYLLGALGKIIALPPGDITLVWPPSGIALAAVVLYGYRATAGIFLGAFVLNAGNLSNPDPTILLAGAMIAAGSVLQPVCGRFMMHKLRLETLSLDPPVIAKFLVLSALMTTVSSSIGTFSLFTMDLLQVSYGRAQLTWWLGDFLGVLVFTPLTLSFFHRNYFSHENRLLALLLIMAGVSVVITAVTVLITFSVFYESQKARLREVAQSQANIIEAVARFDSENSTDIFDNWQLATLSQVDEAYSENSFLNGSTEYLLARKEGDNIVYASSFSASGRDLPAPVPFDGILAQPMFRALSGESGIMEGLDHQGAQVLAAYEYVDLMGLGLVVKTDLDEIRRPFLNTVVLVAILAAFLIISATLWFQRISAPLLKRLQRKSDELQKLVDDQTLEIRENEKLFHSLLDSAPESMVIVDTRGKIQLVNSMCTRLTGFTSEELVDKHIEILIPDRFESTHKAHRAGYMNNPVPLAVGQQAEPMLLRKDGTEIPVSVSLNPIDTVHGILVAASIRDISAQKEYEQTLIDSEARLTLALESGDMEVYEVDIKNQEIQSNTSLYKRFGYTPPDTVSTIIENDPWTRIIHPDDRERVLAAVLAFTAGQLPDYKTEYRVLTSTGEIKWIETNGMITERDENGKPLKMVGVRHDISEIKTSETELNQKLEELESFNKLAIGRELKMIDLKVEINELCQKLGERDRYDIVE